MNAIDKGERPSFPSDVLLEVREVIELCWSISEKKENLPTYKEVAIKLETVIDVYLTAKITSMFHKRHNLQRDEVERTINDELKGKESIGMNLIFKGVYLLRWSSNAKSFVISYKKFDKFQHDATGSDFKEVMATIKNGINEGKYKFPIERFCD